VNRIPFNLGFFARFDRLEVFGSCDLIFYARKPSFCLYTIAMMKRALHFRSKLVLLLLCVVAMLCLVHVSCAQPDSVDVDEELETNFNLDQEGWRGPRGGRVFCRRGLCPPGTVCVESPKQCLRAPCPQYDCVPRYSRFGIPL